MRHHNDQNLTHSAFSGTKDFHTQTGKFFFEDEALDRLADIVARCYEAGPDQALLLTERATEQRPYIVDIDVECSSTGKSSMPEMAKTLDWLNGVLKHQAVVLQRIYPSVALRAVVFEANGWSQQKGLQKVSYHLVFPDIIVDQNRADLLRHTIVESFIYHSREDVGDPAVRKLLDIAVSMRPCNDWRNIMDSSESGKNGLRMPFCDKAFRDDIGNGHKVVRREYRPCVAVGCFEFKVDRDGAFKVTHEKKPNDLLVKEWIRLGSCRRPSGTPLTSWSPQDLSKMPRVRTASTRSSCGVPRGTRQVGAKVADQIRLQAAGLRERDPRLRSAAEGARFIKHSFKLMAFVRYFKGGLDDFKKSMTLASTSAGLSDHSFVLHDEDQAMQWRMRSGEKVAVVKFHKTTGIVVVQGSPPPKMWTLQPS